MVRLLSGLAALAVVPFATLAAAGSSDEIVRTIVDKDTLLQRATKSYDVVTLQKLISDDFTLGTSSGRFLGAREFLAEIDDRSVKWFDNEPEDVRVRTYNGDCAIVTAILHERFEAAGKVTDVRVRYTDTWVKLGGVWRYVAGHASRI